MAMDPQSRKWQITVNNPEKHGLTHDVMRTDSVEGDSAPGTFKDVVSRIFGSYTPVTSAETVTETVNGETVTTIIDVVAPGAAGVDYVWLSGVLLFALMLFCLFKLLGGIIS